jgi:hypothetical protein
LITLNGKFFQKTAFATACVGNKRFAGVAAEIHSKTKRPFVDNHQMDGGVPSKELPVFDVLTVDTDDCMQIAG